jgi:ribonuclease P protein component
VWYLPVEELEAPVSILVSVSKRRFKRAVKRNRVKRQIREAYRKNKHGLLQTLQDEGRQLAVAFIYLSDRLVDSVEIEERMKIALARITEKVLADVAVQKAGENAASAEETGSAGQS